MEPVGLAVGLAGLVGTFTACLDIVDRIDSYKDYGVDSRAVISQFDADRLLFRQWGKAVGFEADRQALSDEHHKRLDDPTICLVVQKILNSIEEIAGERSPRATGGLLHSRTNNSGGTFDRFRENTSHKRKLGWTMHKARFHALAQQFGGLVDKLHALVPPESSPYVHAPATIDKGFNQATYFIDLQRVLDEAERQIEREMRKDLETWLHASHTNSLYDDALQKRLPGTCDWILDRETFRTWQSSDYQPAKAKVLWINGPAGYGKTILSTRILQNLEEESQSPVASFFFSSDLEDRADPFVILRSWLSQVISRSRVAFEVACEKQGSDVGKRASAQDLLDLLKALIQKTPHCTFIVDGLDECTSKDGWSSMESKSLAYFVRETTQALSGTQSRMLVVSREDRDIREGFYGHDTERSGLELGEYHITPVDVQPDAVMFSQHIVNQKLRNKPKEMRDGISQRIVSRCDSMFLRIKLLENDLRGGKSQKALERIVDQIPTELGQLYDRNWKRIMERENDRSRAFAILRWVTFALRPMTILEITEALLLEDDDSANNMEDELPDSIDEDYVRTEILDLCASLLETRATDAASGLGEKTLHLTHFTVRQYILDHIPISGTQLLAESRTAARMQGLSALSLRQTHITVKQYVLETIPMTGSQMAAAEKLHSTNESIHGNILAEMCLRYLCLPWACEGPDADSQDFDTVQRSFRKYAADHWHAHFQDGFPNAEPVMGLIITLFNAGNAIWESWRQYHDTQRADSWYMEDFGNTKPTSRLFYAASLGLQWLVEQLVENDKVDVDYVDDSGRTALLAAAATDRLALLRYLLGKGANPNMVSKKGRGPLYAAVRNADIEMTRLLLDEGARWKDQSFTLGTSLISASATGQNETVQLLLDRGADCLVRDADGCDPLFWASRYGHVRTAQLLIERGADIFAQVGLGWTPLNIASSNGWAELVRLLLSKGANMEVPNTRGWTPLLSASVEGHLEVVRLLLARGADYTATDKGGFTALHLASYDGHLDVVQLLLENGVDFTETIINGWTPMNAAAITGNFDMAKLLLGYDADCTTANAYGYTPVHNATKEGHTEVVRLLLDKTVDMTPDDYGWTPLVTAAYYGFTEIVRLFLDRDADPEAKDKDGWTALIHASSNGYTEIVRLLLSKGADTEAEDEDGWTALIYASRYGHTETVRLLLSKGADTEAEDEDGWTALAHASNNGYTEIVRLLLSKGTEMFSNDSRWIPLTIAASQGHAEIMKQLLAKDGQAWAKRDVLGRFPLHQAVAAKQREAFDLLMGKHCNLDETDLYGALTISFAARYGDLDMVERVLAITQADINEPDRFGRTALWWAKRQGHADVVARLERKAVETLGLVPATPDLGVWEPEELSDPQNDGFCDICYTKVANDTWVCSICFPLPDQFCVCVGCKKLGAHCLDEGHTLVQREGQMG